MRAYFLILCSVLWVNCSQKKQKEQETVKTPDYSLLIKHTPPKKLNNYAFTKVKDWTYYNVLREFLKRFENISANEGLSNALELKSLVKDLKENISIVELNTSAFRARLNVLENEALRLADMTRIPSISAKEVNSQIDKVLLLFNSLNEKINAVYHQKQFDDNVNLEDFFKLDSVKKPKNILKPIQ